MRQQGQKACCTARERLGSSLARGAANQLRNLGEIRAQAALGAARLEPGAPRSVMDRIRYFLAVLNIVVLPCGLLYWFLIHPFARGWRKLGPARTFIIVLLVISALGVLIFRWRALLIGADLGTSWILVAIALVLFVPMFWLEHEYKKHLSIAILSGYQELSPESAQTGRMLNQGIYSVVRHPRYLSAGIGVIAGALIANYVGLYILLLLLLPLGYAMVKLEEHELIERFGDEYRKYRQEVPAIIPRWRR